MEFKIGDRVKIQKCSYCRPGECGEIVGRYALEYWRTLDEIILEIMEEHKCALEDLSVFDIKHGEEDRYKDRYIVSVRGKKIREIHGEFKVYGYSIRQFDLNQ